MRKITPELNEVKEIYKDDRQKQANETMKLMKKHGANPLGGCLPLLIQMPFFIGFFFALREMVELRHSELGFWADLSAPRSLFCFAGFVLHCYDSNPTPLTHNQQAWIQPRHRL